MSGPCRSPELTDVTTGVVGEVEAVLRDLVAGLEPPPGAARGRGRPRILPALCLWAGLLVCVLEGFRSQLALWRLLSQTGLWDYPRIPISDQAVYHRLARDGIGPLEHLFAQLSTVLAARLTPSLPHLGDELAPFAREIMALDETTLDTLARRLPATTDGAATARRVPGKLAGLFDVRRQQWQTVQFQADATQNEKVLARSLARQLPVGSLLLFDLGYFAFRWFDDLTEEGYFWVSRLRQQTSYSIVHVFTQHGDTLDALVWLGAYRADRAKHLVRLVQFRQGGQLRRYLTNVRDPSRLSLAAIAQLYARRWDFEVAVQLAKQHLGLHLWWSTNEVVVQQQLYAVLIIAQILQALRLEIAVRAGVGLFDVSLPLLVRYAPQFARRGEDPVTVFVTRGRAAGFIRPSRRIQIQAPDPPLAVAWSLGPVPLQRTPRYAERKCTARTAV